ncbi:T9SS type A sorting domain-containing protein [Brumimicrobium glaciale]|uniref:T9SS type A sorting domain-containing protein n=1 Tax=Brumimicrobium glaciale TaxID=200475 RepID=A0A4Q4KGY5_9FLAO|nr:kelch repeat-containing protein [Brumimicrobium glaciale]RYM31444.1 T9SS type A sorting domain-containing protein [Brumimicrobium glaciale]
MKHNFTALFTALLFFGTINAQSWQQKSSNPGDSRHHPVSFSLDGKGYMVTGSTDLVDETTDFYEYDPVADTWATLPDFTGVGRGFSIGDTWNGKAYMGFGFGANNAYLNDLWVFDPATNAWTELASCPCAKRIHPTFVIEDGLLFVGMGNNNVNGNMKDWWEYNIASDSWRQLPDLPGLERHHPYMFSADGDVYTGLGHGNGPGTKVFKDWYKWEIATETWVQLNDFPAEGRVAGTQLSIGDRGFIISGDGDNHNSIPSGEFWEYDYQNDAWNELPPHPGLSRWAPGSFAIGNVVYFGAGQVRNGSNAGLKNDLWSFDLATYVGVTTENKLSEITLYPNPVISNIQLNGISSEDNATIQITNSAGQTVFKQNYSGGKIDASHLNAGFYFLNIIKAKGTVERIKFIKH